MKKLYFFLICSALSMFSYAQVDIKVVDFDADGATQGYTISGGPTNTTNQFWNRFDKTTEGTSHDLGTNYSANVQVGTHYLAGEFVNIEGVLTFTADVSDYEDLNLAIDLANPHPTATDGMENTDHLIVEYSFNGTDYTELIQYNGDGDAGMSVDGDDLVNLSTSITTRSLIINEKSGATLYIRVRVLSSAATEEILIDNIKVQGTIDASDPTASAPINAAQTIKGGTTSTSTVRSTESGNIYLFLSSETAPTTQLEIDALVADDKAFLGKSDAEANTGYTITPLSSLLDGLYNIIAVDYAGNVSLSVAGWLTVDNTAPEVASIVRQNPTTSPTNADALVWDVTFDESVDNVNATDFSVTGSTATVSGVADQGSNVYRVTVSGGDLSSLNATVAIGFDAAQDIEDPAGNALTNFTPTGTNENTFVIDNSIRISSIVRQSPASSPTNADILVWDVTFDNTVNNVNVGDFEVSNTTATIASVTDEGSNTYRVTVSGGDLAALNATVTLSVAGAEDITDPAGNDFSNYTPTGTNSNNFVVDNTAPLITSIVRQNPTISPTNADVLVWDVTFNGTVSNVNAADFDVTGTTATIQSVTDEGSNTYRVSVSGGDLATLNGTATIGIDAGHNISDPAGNLLTNYTPTGTDESSFVVDNTDPGVASIERQNPTTSPTNADALVWDVTFDENVDNVNAADFSVSGTTATVTGVADQGSNVYRVTVSGGDLGSLNATVAIGFDAAQDIVDPAGNALTNFTPTGTNENTFVVDNTIRISSIVRQSPASSPTNADILVWDVTFDNTVNNVDVGDFEVSNTTATIASVTDEGSNTYRVSVSGGNLAALNATVTLSVAGTEDITDPAGNDFSNYTPTGINDNNFVVDNTAPLITSIVRQNPTNSPTNIDVLVWDVTFNGTVTNVGTADFAVTGTTATVQSVTDEGSNTYRVSVSGGDLASLNGTATISIDAGHNISDPAGNLLTNYTPTGTDESSFAVDNTAPGIASIERQSPTTSPTNADALVWDVTFDESVDNVNATDFSVSGSTATVSGVADQGSNVYRVTVSGGDLSSLNTTVTLGFDAAQDIEDPAGNALTNYTPTGTNENTFVVDNTIRISSIVRQSPASSPTNADILVWDVTFDNTVNNVNEDDFEVSNTTATIASVTDEGSNTYRVSVSGGNLAALNATVTLSVAGTEDITDPAGNDFSNYTPTGINDNNFVVDNVQPQATATVSDATIYTGDLTQVVTVTYDEPMDNGTSPVITFSGDGNFSSNGDGAWNIDNDTWTETFTHNGTPQEDPSVTATVANGSGATDLAGNSDVGDTSPSFLVDTKRPEIIIVQYFPNSGESNANRDVVRAELSEDITLGGTTSPFPALITNFNSTSPGFHIRVDGTLAEFITNTGSGDYANGYNVYQNDGATRNGQASTRSLRFEGKNNGAWDGTNNPALSYIPGGGGIVDLAGNEMAVVLNLLSFDGDIAPPVIVGDVVVSPNGTDPETIVFTVDEILNITEGGAVIGFGVSSGAIATAIYTGAETTKTITLTSAADGQWDNLTTISYTSDGITTNVKDVTGNEMVDFLSQGLIYENTSPTLTALSISSNNADNTLAKGGHEVTITFTLDEEIHDINGLKASSITLSDVQSGSTSVATSSFTYNFTANPNEYTAKFTINSADANGLITFKLDFQDLAGNAGTQATQANITDASSVTVDNTIPDVQSIVRVETTPNSSNDLDFTVTFTEAVTGVDAPDFALTSSNLTGAPAIGVTGSGTTYTVTVNAFDLDDNKFSGILRLDFTSDGTVLDAASNSTTSGYTVGEEYTIVHPEPAEDVTDLAFVNSDNSSIEISWSKSVIDQLPNAWLILAKKTDQTFTTVVDGTFINDGVQANGDIAKSILRDDLVTTYSHTFAGLSSGTEYEFIIYPYTNNGTNINYKTTTPDQTTGATTTAALSTISPGGAAEPTTISSLINAQGDAIVNFDFTITDDGVTPAADDADITISEIIITQGGSNEIADWLTVMDASAAILEDGNGNSHIGDVFADRITFSGIVSTSGELGHIADDASKTYTLKVWLKTSLPDGIDNAHFDFEVLSNNITYDNPTASSTLAAAQTVSSGVATNAISVVATQLAWTTQPASDIGVMANFATAPIITAQDVNGNRDEDFIEAVTSLTNAGGIGMPVSPVGSLFTAGSFTFPATFSYSDAGNGTLSLETLTLTSVASGTVTVSYSNGTTITAGPDPEPLTLPSTLVSFEINSYSLDFIISDDATAVIDDKIGTNITEIIISAEGGLNTNWSDIIEEALLYDFGLTQWVFAPNVNITSNQIIFNMADATSPNLGVINDDGTKTYKFYIRFKQSVTGGLDNLIDNQYLNFKVTDLQITTATGSSTIGTSQEVTSGASNNQIDVDATQLDYEVQPTNTFVNETMTTVTVEANDQYGNRDLDYTGAVTLTSSGTLSSSPVTATLASGVGNTSNIIHSVIQSGVNLTATEDTPTLTGSSIASTAFDILPGIAETDIVVTAHDPDDNITYIDHSDILVVNTDPKVFEMEIRDGGNDGTDTDVLSTNVTSLSFIVNNPQYLKTIGLFDNGNNLLASASAAGVITFDLSGTPVVVPDDGSVVLHLRTTFQTTITDNDQVSFTVSDAVANNAGSTFESPDGAPTSGSAAISSTVGDDNRIEVEATDLVFENIQNATLNTPLAVQVRAKDAHGNLDVDFVEEVTNYSNTSTLPGSALATINNPVSGELFENGIYNFPNNIDPLLSFQFTEPGTGITISLETTNLNGTSNAFDILASEQSFIEYISDAGDIPYIDFPPTGDLTDANSYKISEFRLNDGNPALYGNDNDGAPTVIDEITISISNPINLDKVGVFDGSGVQYGPDMAAGATVNFTGVSFSAEDNSTNNFFIKASFKNDADINDNDAIDIAITNVIAAAGSGFEDATGGEPDGLGAFITAQTPAGNNKIEVVATTYNVLEQPPTIITAGKPLLNSGNPVQLGSVDANGNRDVDYTPATTVDVTSALAISDNTITDISNGILTFSGAFFFNDGPMENVTLTITDGSSPSITVTTSEVDVNASLIFTQNSTDVAAGPLESNSIDNVLLNFSVGAIGASSITAIDISTNGIDPTDKFTAVRIIESADAIFDVADAVLGSFTIPTNTVDPLSIDLSGTPITFTNGQEKFYFIVADIEAAVKGFTTDQIQLTLDQTGISTSISTVVDNFTFNSTFYSFKDIIIPIAETVDANIDIIADPNAINGDIFTLSFTFDEPMKRTVMPSVDFPDEDPTGNITELGKEWSADALTFTISYTIINPGVDINLPAIDVHISGAQDSTLNEMDATVFPDVFDIETLNPEVVSVTASTTSINGVQEAVINDALVGSETFTITVEFNENMDVSKGVSLATHFLSFPTAGEDPSAAITFNSAEWSDSTTYIVKYNVTDAGSFIESIDVQVTDATDSLGNILYLTTTNDRFTVYMDNPTVLGVTGIPDVIGDPLEGPENFRIEVEFNEPMVATGSDPIISFPTVGEDPTATPTITFSSGSWSADGLVYTAFYNVDATDETLPAIDVEINGAQDSLANNISVPIVVDDVFTVNTENPAIISVSAQNENGYYGKDTIISIYVIFDQDVYVDVTGGVPSLALNTGDFAYYVNDDRLDTLVFEYKILVNQNSPDLNYTLNELELNGGIINDFAHNNAILTLPDPSDPSAENLGKNKNIIIDSEDPNLDPITPFLPVNNKLAVPVAANLIVTFNEAIALPTEQGLFITIQDVDQNVLFEKIEAATHAGLSIINDSLLVINPTANFVEGTRYEVSFDFKSIEDLGGNPYPGFSLGSNTFQFQTFAVPTIATLQENSPGATAVCVDSLVTITGKYFEGYTNFEGITGAKFYNSDGTQSVDADPLSITVISDTELTVKVPAGIDDSHFKVALSTSEDIAVIGTNLATSGDISTMGSLIGSYTAEIRLGGDNINAVCSEGSINADLAVDIDGGSGNFKVTYKVNDMVTSLIIEGGGDYVNGSDFEVNPPLSSSNDYVLYKVIDGNNCPVPTTGIDPSNTITIVEHAQPKITDIVELAGLCLQDNPTSVDLFASITGSTSTGKWSFLNGSGTFQSTGTTNANYDIAVNDTTEVYELVSSDYQLDTLYFKFEVTGTPLPCSNPSQTIKLYYTNDRVANLQGDKSVCLTGAPELQVNASISGGATNGIWTAYDPDYIEATGSFENGINTLVAPNGSLSNKFLLSASDAGKAYLNLVLTPQGGTCGEEKADTVKLIIKDLPIPNITLSDIGVNDTIVCANDKYRKYQLYNETSPAGSKYNWQLSPGSAGFFESDHTTRSVFISWADQAVNAALTVTETNLDGCTSIPIDIDVRVDKIANPEFNIPTNSTYGVETEVVRLGGVPNLNGIFSGKSVSLISGINEPDYYIFQPFNAKVGVHPITYTITNDNGCSASVMRELTVYSLDNSFIDTLTNQALANEFCIDHPEIALKISEDTQASFDEQDITFIRFEGDGISYNDDNQPIFNAEQAHQEALTNSRLPEIYLVVSQDGIEYTTGNKIVTINPLPELAFTSLSLQYCSNAEDIVLTRDVILNPIIDATTSFNFYLIEGDEAAFNDDTDTFSPSVLDFDPDDFEGTNVKFRYTYTNVKGCKDSIEFETEFYQRPPQPLVDDTYICEDETLIALHIQNVKSNSEGPAEIEWLNANNEIIGTEAMVLPGNVDPSVSSSNNYTITQTINECESPVENVNYQVLAKPTVSLTGFSGNSLCVDANHVILNANKSTSADGLFIGNITGLDTIESNVVFSPLKAADSLLVFTEPIKNEIIYQASRSYSVGKTCINSDTSVVFVNPKPFVQIDDLNTEFCPDENTKIQLIGNKIGQAGESFEGSGVVPEAGRYYFTPLPSLVGDNLEITYRYTDPVTTCTNSDSIEMTVHQKPIATFNYSTACVGRTINFEDATPTEYASIESYRWEFLNIQRSVEYSSTQKDTTYTYFTDANRDVRLIVTSEYGCSDDTLRTIIVNPIPTISFNHEYIVTNDPTEFSGISIVPANEPIQSVTWNYNDEESRIVEDDFTNAQLYTFATSGYKKVEATVMSLAGCDSTTVDTTIFIVPRVLPSISRTISYSFDNDNASFISNGGNGLWQHGNPTGFKINGNTNAWMTGLSPETYPANVHAYLYTPCFDLTDLDRPMISFNLATYTSNVDGMVLQYSVNGKKDDWITLGKPENGLNWFNVTGINSQPGGQQLYGWQTTKDTTWIEAKLPLDEIPEENRDKVIFRFAFASGNVLPGAELDGAAIDNFFIGERTRSVLLEHFTNINNINGTAEDQERFNTFQKDDDDVVVVKLAYHTAFPANDLLNKDNSGDVGARVLYYNINSSPTTIMDGIFSNTKNDIEPGNFGAWVGDQFSRRTLERAQAAIDVELGLDEYEITIMPEIIPLTDLPENVTVHVGMVEKGIARNDLGLSSGVTEVDTFHYVMKKLLPDARGSKFIKPKADIALEFNNVLKWAPQNVYPKNNIMLAIEDLAVVVFVQGDSTRTIYQATVVDVKDLPALDQITGVDKDLLAKNLSIYPIPASTTVNLSHTIGWQNDQTVKLFDHAGKLVMIGQWHRDEKTMEIDTRRLSAGVYYVQIEDDKLGLHTRKKIMVIQQ